MKTIKVLGGGCSGCESAYKLIESVAKARGQVVQLEKIDDFQEIMKFDVMSTPGIVIDGSVVHRGSVPTREQVEGWFSN